jgi:hypothetical protein
MWSKLKVVGMLFVRRFFLGWISVQQELSEVSVSLNRVQVDVRSGFSELSQRIDRLENSLCEDCPRRTR